MPVIIPCASIWISASGTSMSSAPAAKRFFRSCCASAWIEWTTFRSVGFSFGPGTFSPFSSAITCS